jgi:hypothetical protein
VIRRGGCFTKNEADAQGFECLVKQLLPIFTIVLGFANIDADVITLLYRVSTESSL